MTSNTTILEPDFTKIVDNLLGAEGPVFDKDGLFYMVAPEVTRDDSHAGQVLKIDLKSAKTQHLCSPNIGGEGGIPAGCQVDRNNVLWVADMRHGLLRIQTNGLYRQICREDRNGDIMQGCNDCAFDYLGNLWITAPAGKIAPNPYTRSREIGFGSIYCYTRSKEMIKVDTGLRFPNGIAVQHATDNTPKALIVAETPTKSLWSYQVRGDGILGPRTLWGKLPKSTDPTSGADGMDFDEEDNLLVAHIRSSYIDVFPPNGGAPHTRIKCPFLRPSNLHFQKGTSVVYVTEHDTHGLWKFEWKRAGKLQYCDL